MNDMFAGTRKSELGCGVPEGWKPACCRDGDGRVSSLLKRAVSNRVSPGA